MAVALVGDLGGLGRIEGGVECGGHLDPAAISGMIGRGGSAVIGRTGGGCARTASALLRSGIGVMILDILACSTDEWADLAAAASRGRARLLCGAQLARLGPDLSGAMRGTASVSASFGRPYYASADASLAVPADVAMALFGGAPNAVFAAGEAMPSSGEGAPSGCGFASAMLRFEGGRSALISSLVRDADPRRPDMDIRIGLPAGAGGPPAGLDIYAGASGPPAGAPDAFARVGLADALDYVGGAGPGGGEIADGCAPLSRTVRAINVSLNTGAPVYTA